MGDWLPGTEENFNRLLKDAGFEPAEYEVGTTPTGLLFAKTPEPSNALERVSGDELLEELRQYRGIVDEVLEGLVGAWDWKPLDLWADAPIAKPVAGESDPYAFAFDDIAAKVRLDFWAQSASANVKTPALTVQKLGMAFGGPYGYDPNCDCPDCMKTRYAPPDGFVDAGAAWAGY